MAAISDNFVKYIVCIAGFFSMLSISVPQICYALLSVIFIYKAYKKEFSLRNEYWKYFAAVIFMMAVTSALGVNPKASFNFMEKGAFIFLFFVSFYLFDDENRKDYIICALIGASVAVLYGYIAADDGERIFGVYDNNPVMFGNHTATIFILGLFSIICRQYRTRREQYTMLVSLVIVLLGVILSGTRSAFFAVFAVSLIMILLQLSKENLIYMSVFLLLVVILVYLLVPHMPFLGRQADDFMNYNDPKGSLGWRFVLWKESWNIFLANPIFGIGHDNLYNVFKETISNPYQSILHAHSIYFQTLVDYGLFGAVILFVFYMKLLIDFIKIRMQKICYGTAGICLILTIAILGITDTLLFVSETTMFFWICLGAFMKAGRDSLFRLK